MKLLYSFQTAVSGLTRNKSRSALTILGIVIGITSIILIQSVGEGAENLILSQIQGLGSKTIIIEPGREPRGPSDFASILSDSLKERELKAITNKANVSDLEDATPMLMIPGSLTFSSETIGATTLGAAPVITKILDIFTEEGSFFSEDDVDAKVAVVVLGSETKDKLFGSSDALGEKIKIKDKNFRVAGILSPKGQIGALNIDESVFIPYSTGQQYLLGTSHYNSILASAVSEDSIDTAVEDIERTLRNLHNITDPDKDDFHVMTQADAAESVSMVTGILTALLTSIAAISLVVGGIGIMNIMLVSVTERTREIGLRKALGATNKDILVQFILEAVILTLLGGFVGVLLGSLLSFVSAFALSKALSVSWNFSFPISGALIGIAVAAVVGLIFGIYPARQASLKSPMEALRYE